MFEKYDAYKDSALPSFGNVPKHWDIVPLCSITTLKSITNVGNEELLSVYLDKGVIRFDDVTEKRTNVTSLDLSKYQLVEEGDFVLNNQQAWRGSVGVSIYRGIVSPAYLVLKLSPKVDAKFANYFFRNSAMVSQYLINSKGVGTIQRNLYWQHLKRSDVVLPPREEQIEIAEFLNQKTAEIDQAIAIKEQQIALLNERKQIVIQKAVTQGLDPNVPMKDSGVEWIGQIPEHWECKPSRYAFRAVKRFKRDGTEIKFSVTQKWGVIPTDEMQESATQAVSFDGFQICLEDDLVLNKYKAHLGVFWRAPSRGLITGNYTVFEPLKGINSKYFELLYHTPVYIDIFRTIVYGVIEGMMPLYNNDFYDMLSIVPPLEEQLAIVQYVGEQQKEFSKIERVFLGQIEKLKEYKTTLINDAVTGKIKVA